MIPYVIPQWYLLGLKLLEEEQEPYLDVIKLNHPGDNKTCCTETFWYWLNSNDNATWQQLIDALRSPAIGLCSVATELKEMLKGNYL